ncbi:hypothetical protein [endosymbiont 'TC1' of Trimyema compressum]|uniref:hypothetical protein n=1 Tax=endosymbiont 'TC1' of Trimyema compressum TaxID=243899 RepID=UPI00155F431D|nr:hypothetical protein [endosymbiont 'TC1' of Trimyema compressum]
MQKNMKKYFRREKMDLMVVWLVVIISTLLIEVITLNLGTICFTFGGVTAIIFML